MALALGTAEELLGRPEAGTTVARRLDMERPPKLFAGGTFSGRGHGQAVVAVLVSDGLVAWGAGVVGVVGTVVVGVVVVPAPSPAPLGPLVELADAVVEAAPGPAVVVVGAADVGAAEVAPGPVVVVVGAARLAPAVPAGDVAPPPDGVVVDAELTGAVEPGVVEPDVVEGRPDECAEAALGLAEAELEVDGEAVEPGLVVVGLAPPATPRPLPPSSGPVVPVLAPVVPLLLVPDPTEPALEVGVEPEDGVELPRLEVAPEPVEPTEPVEPALAAGGLAEVGVVAPEEPAVPEEVGVVAPEEPAVPEEVGVVAPEEPAVPEEPADDEPEDGATAGSGKTYPLSPGPVAKVPEPLTTRPALFSVYATK